MFVHRDRFVNPWHAPTCPSGGMSFWTTCQGRCGMGNNIATMEGTITALDGANVRHEEVATATGMKLAVVVGQLTMATETGTHAFVLHSLLGEICLVVEAILPLFNWID